MATVVEERPWPVFEARRTLVIGVILAVVGLGGTAIAVAFEPRRALLGYLFAYSTVASTAMGALILAMCCFAINAKWPAALRRVAESLTIVFPMLAVLFIPIALGVYYIYTWASPEQLSARDQHLVHLKSAWLNPPGFIVRSAIYLAICTLTAELLRRWSLRRDAEPLVERDGEIALTRERMFSCGMLPPVALALTFASFDWVMSLQPTWFSSMFGFYYFGGGFAAAIALLVIVAWRARMDTHAITPSHFYALGRLLFSFIVFWAYTAYFQGMLIRIADRPVEIMFFLVRTHDGWRALLIALVVVHFIVPFLLLLPRGLKLRPVYMSVVAAIVLVGHLIDNYWLVIPASGEPFRPHLADLAALVGVIGACMAFSASRQRGLSMVAAHDPNLPEGIRYASPL